MAAPRAAKKSSSTATQFALRQGRSARTQVVEGVDDEPQIDYADMYDENEDITPEPSQGTAVQNVILQGYNNVRGDLASY